MKTLGSLIAMLLLVSCGGADSDTEAISADTGPSATVEDVDGTIDPNAGTHRYRFVSVTENPDNGCSTSSEVGDELTQTITFGESRVEVIFVPDDLPEGSEPGSRAYTEQLEPGVWQERVESSSGDGLYVHTIELTDSGIIMTSILAGEPCLASVRERIDG